MNRYLVPKKGWQFLDLAKAYGLGIVVHALSGNAAILDTGAYYEVQSKNEIDFSELSKIQGYLGEDIKEWNSVLATLSKGRVETLRKHIKAFFTEQNNVERILQTEFKGKLVTLPQSLELGASKGIRKTVPSSYSEDQIKIPMDEFYLAVLGAINTSVWTSSKNYIVVVYPIPKNTKIRHVKEIRAKLKESVKGFHRAGYFTMVARIAVRLVKEEKELTHGSKFSPKIRGILYGVMTKTGNQPKPFTSGLFPLDFLHSLIEMLEGEEAIDKWIDILDKTSYIKGYEDIAMTLSKFIAEPTLENYHSYIRLHLRNELRSDSIKFGSYDADSLLEVLKNVEVS